MKRIFLIISFFLVYYCSIAQGIGISDRNFTVNPAAILELQSTNKGFLISRMRESERIKIAVNAQSVGLMVYQIDGEAGVWYYSGLAWKHLATDVEFLVRSDDQTSLLAVVATTGNYEDLKNKPVILTRLRDFIADTNCSTITQEQRNRWNAAAEREVFSGNYEDLENKRDIPTKLQDLEQDNLYYTTVSREERERWSAKAGQNDVLIFLHDFIPDTNYFTLVSQTEKKAWNAAAIKPVFSGDYKDIKEKPVIQMAATTGRYPDLHNLPQAFSITTPEGKTLNLSIVAITGNYEDLIDKPIFTDKNGEALQFATVATTGSYKDIKNNIDESIPKTLAQLTPDDNYYTTVSREERERWSNKADSTDINLHLRDLQGSNLYTTVSNEERERWNNKASRNFSGEYKDLRNKPPFADVAETGSFNDLIDTPTMSDYINMLNVATVAKTGDYKDLINTPFIPSKISDLVEELQFRSIQISDIRKWDTATSEFDTHKVHYIFSGNYDELANKPIFASVASTGSFDDIINKPSVNTIKDSIKLSKVAYTGDYAHLETKATKTQLQTILALAPIAYTDSFYDASGIPVLSGAPVASTTSDLIYPMLYSENDEPTPAFLIGLRKNRYARADHLHSFAIPQRIKNFTLDNSNRSTTALITAGTFNKIMLNVKGDISISRDNALNTYTGSIVNNVIISSKNTVVQKQPNIAPTEKKIINLGQLKSSTTQFVNDFNNIIKNNYASIVTKKELDAAVPVGTVVMWVGTDENSLPDCWQIISGTNIDAEGELSGRFVVGAGSAYYSKGVTGGDNAVLLTKENFPPHSHPLSGKEGDIDGEGSLGYNHRVIGINQSSYGSSANGRYDFLYTSILNQGLSIQAHENRPPFYTVYYIEKTKSECK